ncbi:MAG: pantetheine-phosphate adenylyltransferase [Aerococcaceae bacterium]|nr:pantetheine-phosphate adenylyltransferase [Aerococcaceae bacterium]
MTQPKIAIFAGSFDPITIGHVDLIERGSRLFDEIIVLIAVNPNKTYAFDLESRATFIKKSVAHLPNVKVDILSSGLVADYARKVGATALLRGVRNASDSDYEQTLAAVNTHIYPELETIVLYAKETHRYISSSVVRELLLHQGDIASLVPNVIHEQLLNTFK